MKILEVKPVITTYFYVETDSDDFPTFRTDGKGNWERAMGESWETWYEFNDELETKFKKIMESLPMLDSSGKGISK